jgi:hypothetical protein
MSLGTLIVLALLAAWGSMGPRLPGRASAADGSVLQAEPACRLAENIGFACLGLAVAFLLLWSGLTNKGNDRGESWAHVVGLAFAVIGGASL